MRYLILPVFAFGLHAQTMVEYGVGVSRAATSAAPAAGVGKSVKGALKTLDKTLKTETSKTENGATQTVILRPAAEEKADQPASPAKVYEDIRKAETGLAYEELVTRFGPPSLEMALADGVKQLTYGSKSGSTRIQIREGKVASIAEPKAQAGVLVLGK
jgi:hypothetical protein